MSASPMGGTVAVYLPPLSLQKEPHLLCHVVRATLEGWMAPGSPKGEYRDFA